MKRISPVFIAAIGAGLIGMLVMIAGADLINECYDERLLREKCLRVVITVWPTFIIVFVCAGIGGAVSARFFGRKTKHCRARLGFGVLGAFLSTLCGGVLAGTGLWIFDSSPPVDIVASAVLGGVFSFIFAFNSWFGAISWIGGFILLDLIIHRRRQMDDPSTERGAP